MKKLQETIDLMAAKVIEQGKQAIDKTTGDCVYRACDGSKCAVGMLIPKDKYDERIESLSVSEILHDYPGTFGDYEQLIGDNQQVFFNLQRLHDSGEQSTRESQLVYLKAQHTKLNFDAWKPWVDMGK